MHSVWEYGWTFHLEGPNVVVKYMPAYLTIRYSYAFNSAESANEFWERVHQLVADAEVHLSRRNDPYGWTLREVMAPHYREIRKREQNELRR